VTAAVIIVALRPEVLSPASPALVNLVREIRERKFNEADENKLTRGYYEDLGDVARFSDDLGGIHNLQRPPNWDEPPFRSLDDAPDYQYRVAPSMRLAPGDLDSVYFSLSYEYNVSSRKMFKGILHTTNSHGMRDREYTVTRPPGTFRIALVGASHDAGNGVLDAETYENLVEDRLNLELAPRVGVNFEVLNFSCEGYGPLNKLDAIERKALEFQPQVILYVANSKEMKWMFKPIPRLIQRGLLQEFSFLQMALVRTNVSLPTSGELPDWKWFQATLQPRAEDVVLGIFERVRSECELRGIHPALVVSQTPLDGKVRSKALERLAELGQEAGLPLIDLFGALSGVEDPKSLWIAPWDDHTNPEGHRLLAGRLYQQLIDKKIVPSTPSAAALAIAGVGENRAP
jgi:hypothetical protein